MTWLKSLGDRLPASRPAMLALAIALSATACVPMATRPVHGDPMSAQQAREAALAGVRDWSFTGRIALSQEGRGGSGRIVWRQQGDLVEVQLTAPVTGQGWRLLQTPGHAVLEGLEGGTREGADAAALIEEATGWRIPVTALSDWVRGIGIGDGPGEAGEFEFGPDGRLARLREAGWVIEYRAWNQQDPALPTKLFARRDQSSVRLVVDEWGSP